MYASSDAGVIPNISAGLMSQEGGNSTVEMTGVPSSGVWRHCHASDLSKMTPIRTLLGSRICIIYGHGFFTHLAVFFLFCWRIF
jgi:hypothetical protein